MFSVIKFYLKLLCAVILFGGLYADEYLTRLGLNELYSYDDEVSVTSLPPGDSNFDYIKLETPIHFFSEKYDHIYINTNGILTFLKEYPDYVNQPFPLEYPTIAPFYSNIDTTASNNSAIVFFESQDLNKLNKASELVKHVFYEQQDFAATVLYVATWKNVGYYNSKIDKLNTFQAILICDRDQTFVQFVYPEHGINWLQAEVGELGLPDIRAQAGFMSEDGRLYTLNGSGTDNVRYLSAYSNIDIPGVWLYRVGELGHSEDINEPNNIQPTQRPWGPKTCADGSHQKCHSSATCIDKQNGGFCCRCKEGYYGNGFTCIKSTIPMRVLGSLSGIVNNEMVSASARLQSYIVTADGRSYTAINPIGPDIGPMLVLILPFGGALGWLFAKPMNSNIQNGYQLTGGELHHVSVLTFKESGEVLTVNQTFEGLNYWDQLSVNIDLQGNLPYVPVGAKLHANDYIEQYTFLTNTEIISSGNRKIEIPSEKRTIEYSLEQRITFKSCKLDYDRNPVNDPPVLQKVSKIVLDYSEQDQAVRIGLLNKIGIDPESNPCTDGTATCGDNTICIPHEDGYDCVCKNGYEPDDSVTEIDYCVDINECQGSNICDEHAYCENTPGGYTCTCFEGYEGNGHECHKSKAHIDFYDYDQPSTTYDYSTTTEVYYNPCRDCSRDSVCINYKCVCKTGFTGDGYYCRQECAEDQTWVDGRCQSYTSLEAYPDSTPACPEGYDYSEDGTSCVPPSLEETSDSKQDEQIPCDVDFNCDANATCEWSDQDYRHVCICKRGYEGDGYTCNKIEISCSTNRDLCDLHASCVYDELLRKSKCVCDTGYEGDGFSCHIAPQCYVDSDCGLNTFCDMGICVCSEGYQRDLAELCVPSGTCGGAYCAENAQCQWEPAQRVQYCQCPPGFVGDGITSCKSIPPPCNIRSNCGLYASCLRSSRNPAEYECVCDQGFYGDGYVCVEEKNCRNTPNLCDPNAKCSSTVAGLQCICNSGFFGNGTFCKEVTTHDSGFLLISQGVVIVRIPFNGKLGKPISVAQMAIGLDKDCAEGRIYWGDISAKKIMSAKYDGTDSKAFINEDIHSPEGIAVDWISRRLYWTDSIKDTIEVASLDNPKQRTVLINKHLVNPRGIAVDPYRNKLYWSDWNRDAPKIEMSDLDGTAREVLLSKPSVQLPNSLVVLRNNGEMCYVDAGTKKIECLDTYTKAIRPIASNLSYPFGLTSTGEHFYWTDWTTKKIESVDIYGNRQQGLRTPFFGSHKMYGMTAVTEACPVTYSPCQINNGGCPDERLCIVNLNAPSSKSCKCTRLSKLCNEINLDY